MRIKSLRAYLLVWLLGPLTGVVLLNVADDTWAAANTAGIVTDRMLVSSATDIAEHITARQGVPEPDVPPGVIEMFDTGHGDIVFYAVLTRGGRLLAGSPDVPFPEGRDLGAGAAYYRGNYRGHDLRLVAISHTVIGADEASPVAVIVGVTLNAHRFMIRDLLLQSGAHQLLLLIVATVLVMRGFYRALDPVMRLHDVVLRDDGASLEPIAAEGIHAEFRPLVTALNSYKRRLKQQVAAQARFVANAAHQFKTPLAVLTMQAAYAQRAADDADRAEALGALQKSVRQYAHLVNQLLTLSRAEPGARPVVQEPVDMTSLVRTVLEDFTQPAFLHRIELSFEAAEVPLWVNGDPVMLQEMVLNLVDNALRYTPAGGEARIRLLTHDSVCLLQVADTGPGIPKQERAHVFERFYRVVANGGEGSGLGLAIVREVVDATGGSVTLGTPPWGRGLAVDVSLPLARSRPAEDMDGAAIG